MFVYTINSVITSRVYIKCFVCGKQSKYRVCELLSVNREIVAMASEFCAFQPSHRAVTIYIQYYLLIECDQLTINRINLKIFILSQSLVDSECGSRDFSFSLSLCTSNKLKANICHFVQNRGRRYADE